MKSVKNKYKSKSNTLFIYIINFINYLKKYIISNLIFYKLRI